MKFGVPKETFGDERRVALVPSTIPLIEKLGGEVIVERGAGAEAGFVDAEYEGKGAKLASRAEVFQGANILLQVRGPGANPTGGAQDLSLLNADKTVIAMLDPLSNPQAAQEMAKTGASSIALELIPRITRAQSMDVLSSMATVAGYKAVLIAATTASKMFPMLMTAAGTIKPAKTFIIGAGVAGLQAIATAKRLGSVVSAYDVRPAVKEQVQSVGAKFIEMELEASASEDKGGYAKELGEDFYRRQRELMDSVVSESDIVITTAAIPGKKSPVLVTKDMVDKMSPGSVIVDLAAERGGNCELTKLDETVIHNGVTILGPGNLPSTVPADASQMYSKNVLTLLKHLVKDKNLVLDAEDEITGQILVTRGGDVVHARIREILGLAPAAAAPSAQAEGTEPAKKEAS